MAETITHAHPRKNGSEQQATMDITNSKETGPEHIDEKGAGPDLSNSKYLNHEAAQATANEHSLGLWQALKTYKRAALWSIRK